MNYTDYSYRRLRDRDFMNAVHCAAVIMAPSLPSIGELTRRAAESRPRPIMWV